MVTIPGCVIWHTLQRGLYNGYGNILVIELALKMDRKRLSHWHGVF